MLHTHESNVKIKKQTNLSLPLKQIYYNSSESLFSRNIKELHVIPRLIINFPEELRVNMLKYPAFASRFYGIGHRCKVDRILERNRHAEGAWRWRRRRRRHKEIATAWRKASERAHFHISPSPLPPPSPTVIHYYFPFPSDTSLVRAVTAALAELPVSGWTECTKQQRSSKLRADSFLALFKE